MAISTMSTISSTANMPAVGIGSALPSGSGRVASAGTAAPSPVQAAPAPVTAAQQDPTPGPEELNKLVASMQNRVSNLSSDLEFSVDDDSGKSIIKVTERTTKDVIWQFPSEQALQVTRELDRFQSMLSRKV